MTIYVENEGDYEYSFSVEEQLDKLAAFVTDYVGCPYEPENSVTLVTKEEIHNCHDKGIGVNVWTVNKKKHMKQMAEWEVDGIFTNYPNKAKKLKEKGMI